MQDFNKHMIDFAKGMLAAVVANMILTILHYVGAHIDELIGFAIQAAVATTTIKISH